MVAQNNGSTSQNYTAPPQSPMAPQQSLATQTQNQAPIPKPYQNQTFQHQNHLGILYQPPAKKTKQNEDVQAYTKSQIQPYQPTTNQLYPPPVQQSTSLQLQQHLPNVSINTSAIPMSAPQKQVVDLRKRNVVISPQNKAVKSQNYVVASPQNHVVALNQNSMTNTQLSQNKQMVPITTSSGRKMMIPLNSVNGKRAMKVK